MNLMQTQFWRINGAHESVTNNKVFTTHKFDG